MGFSLADQLASEDHSITIVDTHEAALRRASDTLDVMSVKGNGVSASDQQIGVLCRPSGSWGRARRSVDRCHQHR